MDELEALIDQASHPRELVNLAQAARRLSVPYQTLASWKRQKKVQRAGIDAEGKDLFDLTEVRRLAETTKRRKHRRK